MTEHPLFVLKGDLSGRFDYSLLIQGLHFGLESLHPGLSRCEQFVPLGTAFPTKRDPEEPIASASMSGPRVVIHVYPPPWSVCPLDVNIAWNLSRTPDISPNLLQQWKLCDAVITSSFNLAQDLRKEFANYEIQILYFPFPVQSQSSHSDDERLRLINIDCSSDLKACCTIPYVFGTIVWPNNDQGLESTLRAYVDAFESDERVVLAIWFVGDPSQPEFLHRARFDVKSVCLKSTARELPSIRLIVDWLNTSKALSFARSCNCLVSASRWDSIHAMAHLAMSAGTPIIAPDYGNRLEYCWQETMSCVRASMEPVYRERDDNWFGGRYWYEVSLKAYGDEMRKAHCTGAAGEGTGRVEHAREYVEKVCHPTRVAALFCQALLKSNAYVRVPALASKLSQLDERISQVLKD